MCSKVLIALALLGLATSVAANGRSLSQAKAAAPKAATAAAPTAGAADTPAPAAPTPTPAQAAAAAIKAISEARGTTTNYPVGGKEGKDFPRIVGPTFKFGFKDGIGAFQGWNGGLELPKTIDLGGQRTTRSGLRGRKLSQAAAAKAPAPAPAAATSAPAAAGAADTPAPAAPTPTPAQAAAAAIKAISEARGTTTNYPVGGKEGKDFPRIVGPTFKFGFKDGIGAFQGWNGGLELPKTIDLGGQRTTRSGLRGRKLSQAAAAKAPAPAPAAATSAPAAAGAADTPAPAAPTPTPAQAAAAAIKAISEARGTTTNYPVGGKEGKDFPRIVGPTFKFGFKDGIGAFQGWNGGLELPKTIDLGGQRTTRSGLRGKKMH